MEMSETVQTDYAVLISDNWNALAFDEWKPNARVKNRNHLVEAFQQWESLYI
jgi:hypothetical protein